MSIGMNLAGINYWSTEEPFIDRFHTAGSWQARNAAGTNVSSSLALNDRGDPTNLTGVTSLSVAIGVDPKSAPPTDQYVLTYDGTATVSLMNSKIISQTAGKVVFEYTGADGSSPNVYTTFTKLDPANPVGHVHLVRADQQDLFNAGEIFNPDFVAKASQWGVLRFMDWGATNDSGTVNWSSRTTLDDATWTTFAHSDGVPLEAMVKLANEAHVDMWYNLPTKAGDDYVRNALTYIRDNLDPALKVHVEWSNEVWNSSFAANGYAQDQANALWGNGSVVSNGANIYYGYRSAQVSAIAHELFTDTHAGQLVDVLAGQAANSGLLTYILQGVAKAGLGSASSLFKDYAIAPYFGSELSHGGLHSADRAVILNWANSGSAGVDAAFHELRYGGSLSYDVSLAAVDLWMAKSANAAMSAGLNLVTYEAGASLDTTFYSATDRPIVQAFFGKLMNDARMGDLYTKLIQDFHAAGGTDFLAFNDASTNSTSGYYGVLDSIYGSSSPRYDALIAAINGETLSTVPTSGVDHIFAKPAGGTINALAGDDIVTASSGNDTIDGGGGNDLIVGSSSKVNSMGYLVEKDYYYGGAGSDTILGGVGNDQIWGNEPTSPTGAPDGADSLNGGGGMDAIHGNVGNDTINGGDGNDALYGGEDNDLLSGDAGKDNLLGESGNDAISGGADDDVLRGGSGDDTLNGDDGNDTLMGELGHDVMSGGAGQDTFSFAVGKATFATTGTAAYVTDEITDLVVGTDKIALGFHPVEILHGSAATIGAAATWATQALQSHAGAADVAAVSVGTDTFLFYNDGGTGGVLNSAIHLDHIADSAISLAGFI